MNKNGKSLVFITAIITAAVTFLATSAYYAYVLKSRSGVAFSGSEKIIETLNIIDKNFYYDIDKKKVVEKAVDSIMESLQEPYTTYMDQEEYKKFEQYINGSYAGIGAVVLWDTEMKAVIIARPFEDSPAQKAGLVKGDKIIKIDGQDLSDTDLDGAVARMKGEKGTNVVLTVIKIQTGETIDVNVIRDEIKIPSVDSEIREGEIGYIAISMFDIRTGDEFNEHLQKVLDNGAKGIILDLRDNGGGIVGSVTAVANQLLERGQMIFYTQDKQGNRQEHKSYGEGIDIPIVVLVNENTASASELLAGALRDNKGSVLVGKKTFGKGVVQMAYPLSDGSVIKLTIQKYFTPSGFDINNVGITPDYEVELVSDADEQYQKAVEVINNIFKS
jgi:carboxyl-terminal processing protease